MVFGSERNPVDAYSNRLIELKIPEEKRIIVEEADAVNFACNAVK